MSHHTRKYIPGRFPLRTWPTLSLRIKLQIKFRFLRYQHKIRHVPEAYVYLRAGNFQLDAVGSCHQFAGYPHDDIRLSLGCRDKIEIQPIVCLEVIFKRFSGAVFVVIHPTLTVPEGALQAGNNYTYTVKVRNKVLEVSEATIAKWNDIDGGEVGADL